MIVETHVEPTIAAGFFGLYYGEQENHKERPYGNPSGIRPSHGAHLQVVGEAENESGPRVPQGIQDLRIDDGPAVWVLRGNLLKAVGLRSHVT